MEIFLRRVLHKALRLLQSSFSSEKAEEEIMMILPITASIVDLKELPHDYLVRQYDSADFLSYQRLMFAAGMGYCPLDHWPPQILEGGFFVVEHLPSGVIVAACFASEEVAKGRGRAGNFGWLASHPGNRGLGLGEKMAKLLSIRLLKSGLSFIYLGSQVLRLSAINLYLQMGWIQLEESDRDIELWRRVFESLESSASRY